MFNGGYKQFCIPKPGQGKFRKKNGSGEKGLENLFYFCGGFMHTLLKGAHGTIPK